MNIIKVLESMTKHSGPWSDKEILAAVHKVKIHKESRENIATAVLQGYCSRGSSLESTEMCKIAVRIADTMIGELNKNE